MRSDSFAAIYNADEIRLWWKKLGFYQKISTCSAIIFIITQHIEKGKSFFYFFLKFFQAIFQPQNGKSVFAESICKRGLSVSVLLEIRAEISHCKIHHHTIAFASFCGPLRLQIQVVGGFGNVGGNVVTVFFKKGTVGGSFVTNG